MSHDLPYEEAYKRLETILEKMNSRQLSLDDSLRLYEEADQLIASCSKRLNEAEKRIEVLIKSRAGELELDKEGQPVTTSFSS
jgi:exodeoxyribonuclease VII small subunit